MTITALIDTLKKDWAIPAHAIHKGEKTVFTFVCAFSPEGTTINGNYPHAVPEDLKAFWSVAASAELFKDADYGQWGLQILSPEEALEVTRAQQEWRSSDFESNDLVIGKFLGDSDLLVLTTEDNGPGVCYRIALPMDPRPDWPVAAHSFTAFLEAYAAKEGDKYWE